MAEAKSIEEIQSIVDRVKYKSWLFHLSLRGYAPGAGLDGDVCLQVMFYAPDNANKVQPVLQKGRKFLISRYSCTTEIVETCWAAVQRAELHEMMKKFTYRGVDIFNNHRDVEARVEIAGRVDQRD